MPTLDRCNYARKALSSIYNQAEAHHAIEVVISNNCSDHDYELFESLLDACPDGLSLSYTVQKNRLTLDEHMHALVNLAKGRYVYYLGDDDYFLDEQLILLVELVARCMPDLAIFNGRLIDEAGEVIGSHFYLPEKIYTCVNEAFLDLRDKGTFGAVLVRRDYLDDVSFRALIGTSHAYGCFWLSLLKVYNSLGSCCIIIPGFELVALRMAEKSYSKLIVYFRDIPYELAVYQRHLPPGSPQKLNYTFARRYYRKVTSIIFLAGLQASGSPLYELANINPSVHKKTRVKILISKVLVLTGLYNMLYKLKPLFKLWIPKFIRMIKRQ
jgi:glycosyltransferase involved in cell wall biosynthesis